MAPQGAECGGATATGRGARRARPGGSPEEGRSVDAMDGRSLEPTNPRLMETLPEGDGGRASWRRLRPALFAGYGDLGTLRYDYPVVLVRNGTGDACARSLSAIVDALLREIVPPGPRGEGFRRQLLRLETEIRALVARETKGSLSRFWRLAEAELLAGRDAADRGPLAANLDLARERLGVDGEVIDCDAETPVRFLVHAWTMIHAAKAKAFRKRVEGLILKLSDILRADFMKSDRAHSPELLRSSIGTAFESAFDFNAMSRLLVEGSPHGLLSDDRRRRIEAVLLVLQSQRFYAPGRASGPRPGQVEPYAFIFDNCAAALDAFRDRLPQMVDLIKAISIAELEIENRYRASLHDAFFARFDESAVAERDLALFPSYLVCLHDGRSDAAEMARAFEALASGLPVKVLIQTDDILGDPSPEPPRAAFGGGSARLAAMALGVNNAYVFQGASSSLPRSQERVLKGLVYAGPALFSIFSGATKSVSVVPPYLLAAAATESRAFPTFVYDPAAGPDWATRFHIGDNPQAETDWPVHTLRYEDEDHQRVTETVAFTQVDFAVCDARYAKHCVPASRSKWSDAMAPAGECLGRESRSDPDRIPYVWTVGGDGRLRRTVVDDRMIDAARRCNETWRSLQELGGINNSHARRQLEQARQAWEREREAAGLHRQDEPHPAAPAKAPPAVAAEAVPVVAAEAAPIPPDEPSIETARCTTCNECTQINGRMFKYDENMQAYVADPDAGTYRQLVEAAECCQVSIIHPGKPRHPDEPNLGELIARAAPFN